MGVGGNECWRGAAGDGTLNCKGACLPTSDLSGYFKRSPRLTERRMDTIRMTATSFRSRASRRRSVTSLILAYRTISPARRFRQSYIRFADI